MRTLADVDPGSTVVVLEVTGDDSIAVRLMEMGIIDGESIRVVGRAPLGDPLEISLRHYKLSLRRSEAEKVIVVSSPT